ncbi:MAG: DUF4142 domain-containing protein [Bacteroidia bacterium]
MKKLNKIIGALLIVVSAISCGDKRENDYADFYRKTGVDPQLDATVYNINETDKQFLINAAQVNIDEIDLGMLAEDNAATSDVKDLGKIMRTEHLKSLKEMQALASKKQITLPVSSSADEIEHYQSLSGKTGINFDKEYCDLMLKGHLETIEKFERESKTAQDPEVKQFAASMLPVLKSHLEHSSACRKKVYNE